MFAQACPLLPPILSWISEHCKDQRTYLFPDIFSSMFFMWSLYQLPFLPGAVDIRLPVNIPVLADAMTKTKQIKEIWNDLPLVHNLDATLEEKCITKPDPSALLLQYP